MNSVFRPVMALSMMALTLIAAISCTTFESEEPKVASLNEVIVEDIEELLENGSHLEALQDINFLQRKGRGDPAELGQLRERAIASVVADLETSYKKRDFHRAYGLYVSLKSLSKVHLAQDLSKEKILRTMAANYAEEGEDLLALSVYGQMLSGGILTKNELSELLVYANDNGNRSVLRAVIRRLEELEIGVADSYLEKLAIPIPAQTMMLGTATIWVDKGIKIENGIGDPDRVMGSGFFIDKRGYLLTNYHVIASEVDPEYEGYSRLYIRLPGRSDEKIPAKVIGWDRIFDLALLKVEVEPRFVFDSIGAMSVQPGQKVLVIGSPIDPFLENTITAGIISATGRRKLLQMGDVLQLDAPVNPGNSGGPLINENGELVGIVFAGFQPFEGLNFAIPVNWVSQMLPRLFNGDQVMHSWLGMALIENRGELEVIYAVPGEPAERGGILEGDRIVRINGEQFELIRDLQRYFLDFPPGTLVRVEWKRGEEDISGLFSLKERSHSPIELALERDTKINVLVPLFGMRIKSVGGFLWEKDYVVDRVLRGSIADNASISKDDPLNLQRWRVDEENRLIFLQVFVKKKKAGFLESILQLIAYMELDYFA